MVICKYFYKIDMEIAELDCIYILAFDKYGKTLVNAINGI